MGRARRDHRARPRQPGRHLHAGAGRAVARRGWSVDVRDFGVHARVQRVVGVHIRQEAAVPHAAARRARTPLQDRPGGPRADQPRVAEHARPPHAAPRCGARRRALHAQPRLLSGARRRRARIHRARAPPPRPPVPHLFHDVLGAPRRPRRAVQVGERARRAPPVDAPAFARDVPGALPRQLHERHLRPHLCSVPLPARLHDVLGVPRAARDGVSGEALGPLVPLQRGAQPAALAAVLADAAPPRPPPRGLEAVQLHVQRVGRAVGRALWHAQARPREVLPRPGERVRSGAAAQAGGGAR
mmetsp:Transcript_9682/g.30666  ORF Transcript_9682/g.30666 Transcript_9682/m.30666 type:complete len:300 (-) Transcript_9682:1016-1915(-)